MEEIELKKCAETIICMCTDYIINKLLGYMFINNIKLFNDILQKDKIDKENDK